MKYTDELRATSTAVVALQARTASLRDFRRAFRRHLSAGTRTDLAAQAVRLRSIAADLDALAVAPKDRVIVGTFEGLSVWGPAT